MNLPIHKNEIGNWIRTHNTFVYVFILVIVVFVSYFNSLAGSFLWDDESLIVNNTIIRSLRNIPALFEPDAWPTQYAKFYRPMQLFTYALDYLLWGTNPWGYHLTNILLHTLNSILLFFFISFFIKNKTAAFFAALFFAVHPLHTEAVSYISGRADILALGGLLGMLICFFHDSNKRVHLVASMCGLMLMYIVSLFSKEIAIIFPLVLVIIMWVFPQKRTGWRWSALGIVFLIAIVYLLFYVFVCEKTRMDIYAFSLPQKILLAVKAFALYLGILFFPVKLHMERRLMPPTDGMEPQFMLSVIIVLLYIFFLVFALKKAKKCGFGLLSFTLLIFPVLNIFPLNATFSEHWLYIPFWGLALVFACAGEKWLLWRNRKVIIVLILCALSFSVLTIKRNDEWRDPKKFYLSTLYHSPQNIKILYNLSNVYLKEANGQKALTCYDSIINIIKSYELLTQGEGAKTLLRTMLVKTYNNRGNAYVLLEDFQKARDSYVRAIALKPSHVSAHINIARLYERLKEYKKAVKHYMLVLHYEPDNADARTSLKRLRVSL